MPAEDDMNAFEVFAIYLMPFVIIAIAIRLLMRRYAVDLPDVQKQAGSAPKRRFLLGAWRFD
ncbi:flagellar biosynthesis/type III secretory pathway M-ring protein FliF/YscJ [Bradyrhizobium sp. USDA 3315]